MLILENGEKIMEDGLETKALSFLVVQLLSYPQKSGKKQKKKKKAESTVKSYILILDQPKIKNKSFLGYRWHVLTLRCKWIPTN